MSAVPASRHLSDGQQAGFSRPETLAAVEQGFTRRVDVPERHPFHPPTITHEIDHREARYAGDRELNQALQGLRRHRENRTALCPL